MFRYTTHVLINSSGFYPLYHSRQCNDLEAVPIHNQF
nr:MAG TPA: hypothetical protein [Caudoviricetes sp.]